MEVIGVLIVFIVIMIGLAFLMKHQQVIGWWTQTPHCDEEYKRKRLTRIIEDAQDELDRMKKG